MKYFPEQYSYYDQTLESICALTPECEFPFKDLPFSSYTFNVGKQCICNTHVDGHNLVSGLCLVMPFGNFNFQNGGHLILHELRMVMQLSPGSIILFPSAIISHENIAIGPLEERQAFTAYTPGSMFQWVENAFNRVPKFSNEQERVKYGNAAWTIGKGRFPHITEFF
jgi:hypothetical protein